MRDYKSVTQITTRFRLPGEPSWPLPWFKEPRFRLPIFPRETIPNGHACTRGHNSKHANNPVDELASFARSPAPHEMRRERVVSDLLEINLKAAKRAAPKPVPKLQDLRPFRVFDAVGAWF